ncbi:MAG TPA: SWIM zinc finger family protein [Polyangia bacterium]|jgi:uncharacterized Zn finger protein|nr:SWIM zinc finger family protein [Polyangia bacterium]
MPRYGYGYGAFPEYVSVADRRARAQREAAKLAKKRGRALTPVGPIQGMKIVRTFWGKAWCQNLESYSDFASRLPRGRSYVRHGSVVDLQIAAGRITALVSGSTLYETTVAIKPLDPRRWKQIATSCTGKIDSLVDLIQGNLSEAVMQVVTDRERGLFPAPKQISLDCSCPDWADMCKHVAAVLFGVGARLDDQPELLFRLRGVDHLELVGKAATGGSLLGGRSKGKRKIIATADLSALFGIEMDAGVAPKTVKKAKKR